MMAENYTFATDKREFQNIVPSLVKECWKKTR